MLKDGPSGKWKHCAPCSGFLWARQRRQQEAAVSPGNFQPYKYVYEPKTVFGIEQFIKKKVHIQIILGGIHHGSSPELLLRLPPFPRVLSGWLCREVSERLAVTSGLRVWVDGELFPARQWEQRRLPHIHSCRFVISDWSCIEFCSIFCQSGSTKNKKQAFPSDFFPSWEFWPEFVEDRRKIFERGTFPFYRRVNTKIWTILLRRDIFPKLR